MFFFLSAESKPWRQPSKIKRGRTGPWRTPEHRAPSGNLLYYSAYIIGKTLNVFFQFICLSDRPRLVTSRLILTQRKFSSKLRTVSLQIQLGNKKYLLTTLSVPLELNWTLLLLRRRHLKFYLQRSTLRIKILHLEINDLNVTLLHLLMNTVFDHWQ